MDTALLQQAIDTMARDLLRAFPPEYWRMTDEARAFPEACFQRAGELGAYGILLPEEHGGTHLGPRALARLIRALHAGGADASPLHAQAVMSGILIRAGASPRLMALLPALATGATRLLSVAATEPEAGLDFSTLATTAKRHDDGWRINGSKIYISFAEHSDWIIVLTRAEEGPTLFAVPRESEGLELRPMRMITNRLTTLLFLDEVAVPDELRIGEPGKGLEILARGFVMRRILAACEAVGNARFVMDRAVEHARTRATFGRPIGANQGVQYPLAKAACKVYAAELAIEDSLATMERGDPAQAVSSMARLLAAEAAEEATRAAFTAFGGMALASEAHIERKLRENTVYGFDNLLLGLVAERYLGLPKSL
nr:acyl-CoA/acyl-ACP dehydrogenase [Deltaproteobacteria bacterium]